MTGTRKRTSNSSKSENNDNIGGTKESSKQVPLKEISVGKSLKREDEAELPQLSEYELQMQKNIAERAKLLESLGIITAKEELLEVSRLKKVAREPKSPVRPEDIRKSLRQQHITPDDLQLPLKEASFYSRPSRPPPGPAPMIDYYEHENKDKCQEFIRDLQTISVGKGRQSVWSGSVESVLKVMKSMKIEENLVAKVTSQRTYAIQIHPSLDKTLLLISSKVGELGVWDVERKDETCGAYCFNVHSHGINCLTLNASKPEHVYSTSYDGTVRRTDLVSGIVEEVYCHCEEESRHYLSWHAHQDENCIMVGASEGHAIHVDLREHQRFAKKYAVSDKNVRLISVHPTRNTYFVTGSLGTVRLWDMRKHEKNAPIFEFKHPRAIYGLEFSPITGGSLITTCRDDFLRFISCDLTTLETVKKISHDNNTGRWLTTFKARFLPNRDDMIIVGSMKRPRRIEVWNSEGKRQHEFMGESLASVVSVNAVHPTRPIIAGASCTGKAFVFKSTL